MELLWKGELVESGKAHKPKEIIEFNEVFERHVRKDFVRGSWIFNEIEKLLSAKKSKSNFVLIIGEAGIGKTALMANFISDKRNKVVYYFIEDKKPDRINPTKFAKHLYASLSWIHNLPDVSEIRLSKDAPMEQLRNVISEISQTKLAHKELQLLMVDALDESIDMLEHNLSIIDIILSIDLPLNFKWLITSREMPEVAYFKESKPSNVIQLTGAKDENIEDVKEYLHQNLSSKGVNTDDIGLLLQKSHGNFQYASLIVDLILRDEAEISWLLKNPPDGLEGIYNWKLKKISDRIMDKGQMSIIWKIMGLISLLHRPLSPEEIVDILKIDHPDIITGVFGPLQQFFDIELYNGGAGQCRWYHSSFADYVLSSKRQSKRQILKLEEKIVQYCDFKIKKGQFDELPRILIFGYLLYYYHLYGTSKMLDFARETYFPLVKLKHYKDSNNRFQAIILFCYKWACDLKRPNDIVFFSFFYEASYRAVSSDYYNDRQHYFSGKGKKQEFAKLLKKVNSSNNAKDIVTKSIEAFCKDTIDTYTLYLLITFAFLTIHNEFRGIRHMYSRCLHYANELFPRDSDPEREPKEKGDTVIVILKGKSDRMKRKQVDAFRESGSSEFAILIDKQNERVWYYKKLVSLKDDAYKFLCLLAEQPQGKVKYERIYYYLWKLGPEAGRKLMRDRIHKLLDRGIWKRQQEMKKHIIIDPGIGVMFTEGTTVLVI